MPKPTSSVLFILPTDETLIGLKRRQPALEDEYGVTFKELVELVLETWADIRGLRRPGYIFYPLDCVGFDPVYVLQSRIDDDILSPQMYDHCSEEELTRLIEVLTGLCLVLYLDIDTYLSGHDLPDDGSAAMDRLQWLEEDVVVNLHLPS